MGLVCEGCRDGALGAQAGHNTYDGPIFPMKEFSYVYILDSIAPTGGFYVGLTDDLQSRLVKHNAGQVPYTSKSRPWRIKTAVAFRDRSQAADFERYLKSPSGRAFSKKRL